MPGQTGRDRLSVDEVPGFRSAWKRGSRGDHDGRGPDDDDQRADDRVGALVWNPARRDPLVDDVRLLKEQLPRRHRGADDGDDEEHRIRCDAALYAGDNQIVQYRAAGWVREHRERYDEQAS